MPQPPESSERRPQAAIALIVLAYATIDFMAPAVFESARAWVLPMLLTGAFCGQVGFLAVWAALGPFDLRIRWPLVLATGFGLYFLFCLGSVVFVEYLDFENVFPEAAAMSLPLPLVFLCVQVPLWIRKTLGGWQIVPAAEAERHSAAEARQFGLVHMLGLTTSLAVALALAKAPMDGLAPGRPPSAQDMAQFWLGVGILCGVACLYSAVWTLPAVWASFTASDKGTGVLVMLGVWAGGSVLLIVLLVILASLFGPGRVDGDTAAAIFVHFAGTTIVLLASLHLLRLGGCVMIRADARNKTATPDSRDESGPEERPGEPQIVAEPDPRTD
jgi:hypothetical protein